MKILIHTEGAGAHHFQRMGWARAFQAAGYKVCMWNKQAKPAFDVFDEFEPDIFFGQTYNLDRAVIKCIQSRPELKVVLRASDHSKFARDVKEKGFNILVATDEEVKMVEEADPDFLHGYYDDERIEELHADWIDEGFTTYSSMLAADVFDYTNGVPKPKYECDIAFVGGYWPYKGQNIDRYLIPLCQDKYDYNIKIFGNQGWSVPQYCGWIDNPEVKHLTASAKVCPNVSEPHATEFGYDVNERIFKLLANKCLVVSDYVESAVKLFGDQGVMFAKTPKDFKDLIDTVIVNRDCSLDKAVKQKSEEAYQFIIENHTYFNRVKNFMAQLDLIEEIDQLDKAYQNVRTELKI